MNVEEAFSDQINAKPDNDTFIVYGVDKDVLESGDGGLLRFTVDINDLEDFYNRVDGKYDILGYHEDTKIPELQEK